MSLCLSVPICLSHLLPHLSLFLRLCCLSLPPSLFVSLLPSLCPSLLALSFCLSLSFSSVIGSTWYFCFCPVESAAWCTKSPNLEEIWKLSTFFHSLRKTYPPLLLTSLSLFSLSSHLFFSSSLPLSSLLSFSSPYPSLFTCPLFLSLFPFSPPHPPLIHSYSLLPLFLFLPYLIPYSPLFILLSLLSFPDRLNRSLVEGSWFLCHQSCLEEAVPDVRPTP